MRIVSKEELRDIIGKHHKWLLDESEGMRADLSSADLSYANLRSANLRFANLRSANLSSADLSSADLSYADLSYADLDSNYISISRIGSSKRMTTYDFKNDKIWCGCFEGTMKEFKKKVLTDYPEKDNVYHVEYIEFIKYINKLKKIYDKGKTDVK